MALSIWRFLLFVLILICQAGVIQADPIFVQPSGGDGYFHYTVGSTVPISWTGTDTYYILSLGIFQTTNKVVTWILGLVTFNI
jgi:hypothetical protein